MEDCPGFFYPIDGMLIKRYIVRGSGTKVRAKHVNAEHKISGMCKNARCCQKRK